jgi:VanZ family protein
LNPRTRYRAIATAAIVAMIVYGSLYPFAFQSGPADGPGALTTLLGSWSKSPGRGDFVSNILLYAPLGFFGGLLALSGRETAKNAPRLALVAVGGASLSFAIELLQYYDAGRDTEATDLYANTLGTILGVVGARVIGSEARWTALRGIPANPVPAMLLTAWVGYRLYPYVPTIDGHKYWTALKPVFLHPAATPYTIFRQTTIWLCICLLIDTVAAKQRAMPLLAAFAGLILAGSILFISTAVTLSQLTGMALGCALWWLSPDRWRLRLATVLLAVYVIALRLEPFRFAAPGHFNWIPFLAFMRGSIDIDVQSFCEKVFLYGTLIWLLARSGLRLALASGLVAAALFVSSGIEVYIPGRSAEITDALMALAIGAVMALLDAKPPAPDTLTSRMTVAQAGDPDIHGQ